MRTLYMIRHSLTEANERHLYYGTTDLPLSEKGRQVCREKSGEFHLPSDAVYATTGLLRTEETLSLLFGEREHRTYPTLREMAQGDFEMHSYQELLSNPDYVRWIEDTTGDYVIPNGESANAFHARIHAGLDALLREPFDTLLLVCHAGTISTAMLRWFPDPEKNMYSWNCTACGGYAVRFENSIPVTWEKL